MDLRCLVAVLLLGLTASSVSCINVVFEVHNKLKFSSERIVDKQQSLSAMKSHDLHRHTRLLSSSSVNVFDLPLGGNGNPSNTGLYFTKIRIGTPPKDYYVQVDTGSDILWVNCVGCDQCPTKSDLGIDLTPYDSNNSHSGKLITCNQDFCISTSNGPLPYCRPDIPCPYNVLYGDGSSTSGFYVKDNFQLDRVIGNFQTSSTNASVIFGCAAKQSGELGSSSEALDGILGFGQANSSILSQLASAGKVKKMFAHCLDGINGGGIFAIGNIVQPNVNTTPLVPNMPHYNVIMKAVGVGGEVLQLPSGVIDSGDQKGTVIDSGTTLAYLPEDIYDPLLKAIMAQQPQLKLHTVEEQFTCFQYIGSVDEGFPEVKFYFDGSLTLTVYPHDYLFQIREDAWCFGWQNSGIQYKDGKDMTLLGDLVLSNKLVVYDLENQVIGWTEYNCSSSIKVKDASWGAIYSVGAHDLSVSADQLTVGRILTTTFLLLFMNLFFFTSIHL